MATGSEDPLGRAMHALETVERSVQWIRFHADERGVEGEPPLIGPLERAFDALAAQEPAVFAPRRWALYAIVRGGFASDLLGPALRETPDADGAPFGSPLWDWARRELARYEVLPAWLGMMAPSAAVEFLTRAIRRWWWVQANVLTCDPEDLYLDGCRGPDPTDSEYLTTISAGGNFPRSVSQLARTYDPRMWAQNPYAVHFKEVEPVQDKHGTDPSEPSEPIGSSWSGWIKEVVEDLSGAAYYSNTLWVEYSVMPSSIRLDYHLGMSLGSAGTIAVERDFGWLTIGNVPGQPDWSRVDLQKKVRFTGIPGSSGGNIGWGDLANLLAPALIGDWLADMNHMACWTPP